MASRPDLTAFLIAQKVAGAREIERVARGKGERPLWSALLSGGLLDAARLFSVLHEHAKVPDATEKQLASAAAAANKLGKLFPKEDALRLGILPLELSADGKRVQVGMIDPTDEGALRGLARSAGFQAAKVFLVEHGAHTAAVERAYAPAARGARASVQPAGKMSQRSELEAAERLERVLVQASLGLAAALEAALAQGQATRPSATEAARLAREVARELGHDRRKVAVAGLAAMLVQLDGGRRGDDAGALVDKIDAEIGWAGGGDEGLLAIARALTSQAAGFGSTPAGGSAQQIVQAVCDFLALGSEGESIDIEAAGQLLRASSAGADVVAALVKVLTRDLAERTPAKATRLPEATDRHPQVRSALPRARRATSDTEEHTQLVPFPGARSSDPSRGRS